jgi:hypothetical protein
VNVYYQLSTNGAALRVPWNQEPEFQSIAEPVKVIEQHHELAGAGKR